MSGVEFSIIIPTYDRCQSLQRLLAGVGRNFDESEIKHEIIVANNAPDDETAQSIASVVLEAQRNHGERFREVREPLPGKCKAQNLAIVHSTGSICAFLDDDVEVAPDWLSSAAAFFRQKSFDIMQGAILVPPEMETNEAFRRAQYRYRTINFVQYPPSLRELKTLTGANMAIRRHVFSRVGYFNEELGPGRSGLSEDVEFAQRVIQSGGRIGYEPRAVVYHLVDWSRLTEEFFRQRHEQQGRSRLIYKKQSMASIIPNLIRSLWSLGWYSLVGNERRKYRAKGRYFHYRAMLVEKIKTKKGIELFSQRTLLGSSHRFFRHFRLTGAVWARNTKEYVQKILLVLLGIFLGLVTAELTSRLLPERFLPLPVRDVVQAMRTRAPRSYIQDPELGYVLRPGTDYVSASSEYSFRTKTNLNYDHAGFRGGTLGGPVWGVALGDSFTFGVGVDQESTWVAQLATLSRHEIVNLGVQGYGPQQYTRTLEKYGTSLHPKIVFYCLFTNDLRDTEQFDHWIQHPSAKFSLQTFLVNYSVLVNLYHRWRRSRTLGSRYVNLDEAGQKLSLRKLRDEIISDSRRLPTVWPLIASEIDKAAETSRQANATFIMLYFPSKEEVYWDTIRQKMKSLEAFDDRVDQLRRTALKFCQSRQLICLDLTPALKQKANLKEKLYFSIDTHWNKLGHKVVATEIDRFLVSEKLL